MGVKVNTKDFLYLIWQDPLTRRNYVVGKLSKDNGYSFEYCGEYVQALQAGWNYIKSFPEPKVYHSDTLFPAFSSRLPDKKRKDILKVLQKYKLHEYDGFELLKQSRGRLPIDSYEFVEPINTEEKNINKDFYVAGVRHVADCAGVECSNFPKLEKGMQLHLSLEPDNQYDKNAVSVRISPQRLIGYVPRYYSEDVASVLKAGGTYTCTVLEKSKGKDCHDCVKVNLSMSK